MKNYKKSSYIAANGIDILECLVDCNMTATEFVNNQKIVEGIGEIVDEFVKKQQGHLLLKVTSRNNTKLLLLSLYRWVQIHSWDLDESIDKIIEVEKMCEGDTTVQEMISSRRNLKEEEYLECMITQTFDGYVINETRAKNMEDFLSESLQIEGDKKVKERLEELEQSIAQTKRKHRGTVINYVKKLNCPELKLRISTDRAIDQHGISLVKIDEVRRIGNTRFYKIKVQDLGTGKIRTASFKRTATADSGTLNVVRADKVHYVSLKNNNYNNTFPIDRCGYIPFNMIDQGREMIAFYVGAYNWKMIIGEDPRINPEHKTKLKEAAESLIEERCKKCINLGGTRIENSNQYVISSYSNDTEEMSQMLKELRGMVDEYKYVTKKQKAVGTDVLITDKIKWNGKEGKMSYDDFSISVTDNYTRDQLEEAFKAALLKYYRGSMTEQAILDATVETFFDSLRRRINMYVREPIQMDIVFNDKVKVKLESRITSSRSRLYYINGQKFNRNEIITLLKEMTCYRDQQQADTFIKNVGRLGLSVYIGITTGYETSLAGRTRWGTTKVESKIRIFKFKKEPKGRSNYKMILDTIEIPIKGKALINLLFSEFIEERPHDYPTKVKKTVFTSVKNSSDFLKYRFLIDTAYNSFKKKAKEFLDKKVEDTGSEYTKYHNKSNRRVMEAIKVTGESGREYIVAYDQKESYVFIDPENSEDGVYTGGKYICMVDQSNIKSNIGYDTVVSKVMSLKNDSVIASKIYNLEEELDG